MSSAVSQRSARASLAFSCAGHAYAHIFEPIFFIVALFLPAETGLSYEEVLALIVAGKLLYGLPAPLAGWLGDRWSTVGMMAVYFIGLGAAAIAVGLSHGPVMLAVALGFMGLFGSIYHPVGISWLVRNAVDKGKAIGLNGVFGGVGPALAGVVAGGLIALSGWRAAFILPGMVVLGTGLLFLVMVARGVVVENKQDRKPEPVADRGETVRAGIVLSVTMLCAGLVYQATQPSLPKLFEERLGEFGLWAAAGGVTVVYLLAGLTQILAGHLADRISPKRIYLLAALIQVPLLLGLAHASGPGLLLVAVLAVSFNMAGIPAENLLLSRYTPAKWRGTAFGLKFVLSFGVSGLGVPMVSLIRGAGGGFETVFTVLAVSAGLVALAAWQLPGERGRTAVPAAAE
ncbi:MFS transporter [Paramagnetospirillum magneticum]|uniref:Permease of the major facilitator superfamily n=1 Tax=Paramagnetospirillum magneticum (strain ATCC 700264 / AMB-1) TaxID=342108 RepID=Q2W808_PARM1|nr:MFS transporter [Paramagnetospirillum magneticum]BAE50017.1 Permease of the major facilitator superfamily [Paramagnetospirillum magneticum AMB-1]